MNSAEIRQRFLNYFQERGHKVLPSSSLIPFNDPTLLLTSAGMVQFKPYFLGQAQPPVPRATTCQKCFRTSDIEVVGHDGHHLTFFEMLGNFSFGDYFKEKAIPYAFDLLASGFGLDPKRLWAGIHKDDEESFQIWTSTTPIPAERVRRFGDEYNFWAAGPTGPCGPDSEIHYDWGPEYGCGRDDCGPNCEHCDRFWEIWNLVFMQWDRDESGERKPLGRKGIDTGMGLERITAVLSGKRSVFETDLFAPIIEHCEASTGKRFGRDRAADISLRVIADHIRGMTLLVADGVLPSNDGRGYVLRRLIRRTMVHARRLDFKESLSSLVPLVQRSLGQVYPEVMAQAALIGETLEAEEERFDRTLRSGLERLERSLSQGTIKPEEVFYLHDTLGFPSELTVELADERGVQVDRGRVSDLMDEQRQKSKGKGTTFTTGMARSASRFVGYDKLAIDTSVQEVFPVEGEANFLDVFLEQTPFYPEGGGQTADTGWLSWEGGKADVLDVQAQGEAIRHRVRLEAQAAPLQAGTRLRAEVDAIRRAAIARHHSATHLLHKALREVMGEQATQAGSAVFPERATFDFRLTRSMTPEELQAVSRLLNEKIREDLVRRVDIMTLEEARRTGAMALFGETYGEKVRVVSFGDWARELCGGTHVERSGEIGMAVVGTDRSIGAGVRRVELYAGAAAEQLFERFVSTVTRLGETFRAGVEDLPARVDGTLTELKRLQKENATLRERLASGGQADGLERAQVDGFAVFMQRVPEDEKNLLLFADHALNRDRDAGLALVVSGRRVAVKVGPRLSDRLPAQEVMRAFMAVAGGKGGGRGPVGEGGGIDPARVNEGFLAVQSWMAERLREER